MTPLKGIKVLDLSQEITGPFCSMQLSDGGAEVIKVEPVDGDWTRKLGEKIKGESSLFMSLNRGKKSIALNLQEARGRDIVLKLANKADVLIEDFGPGRADEMGIGYDRLSKENPRLIYCAISPFGTVGPYADYPASELEIQGMAGFQWFLGETGGEPVRLGVDMVGTTGGIWSFIGILSALFNRKTSGKGQKIDSSQFLNMIMMYTYIITAHYNPDLPGGWHFTGPFDHQENGYKTLDRALMFGMPIDAEKAQKGWEEFCRKVGLDDLLEDPYFKEKGMKMVGIGRDAQEFKPVIEPALENKTAAEIKAIVEGVGGYSAVFKTVEDILGEPQVAAVDMVRELDHPVAGRIKTIGIPWKLKDTPLKMQGPPPTLGQHTDEILRSIGCDAKEIGALKGSRVVA